MRPSKAVILFRTLFFSYLLSALLLLLLSFGMYKLNLSEKQAELAVFIVYGISCFAGGLIAGKSSGSRRFFWGFLSGASYFLLLLILSVLFQGGTLPELQHMTTVLAACLAGGILGGIVS